MRFSALALCSILLAACQSAAPPTRDSKPNIILILTDDQGYGDVGVHGNDKIRTPTLDRFATDGVELTRFYVEPVCAPTRSALMTGRYHYRSGIIHTSRGGAKMHGDETTLAEMLRGAGYRTGLFGKWHLGDNYPMRPTDQGFEEAVWHKSGGIDQAPDKPNSYFDPWLWRNDEKFKSKGYCTDVFFDAAMAFAEKHRDEPFFIYLPTNAPHTPLEVADAYWKPYADAGLDETTARVYGMVENIDRNLDRLLDPSRRPRPAREHRHRRHQRQRPAADALYGGPARTQRHDVRRRRTRAQLLAMARRLRGSAQVRQRRRPHRRRSHLARMGRRRASPGRPFDGQSLAPLFRGETLPDRTHFTQVHRGLTPRLYQNAAVITQQYKLVLGPETFNDEDWSYSGEPPVELYDLAEDPGESQDLAAQKPDLAADLRARYEAWFADVKSSRDFTPGVIHIGSDAENPLLLCRYQDATFVDGAPTTWTVEIERAGRYEASVNTAPGDEPNQMHVEVNGDGRTYPIDADSRAAVVELPAGPAKLGIWAQTAGRPREIIRDNSALGDVTLRRIEDAP